MKRGLAAFIPALASLATIAVESIGSFLQKKCIATLSKGLNAIKSDQSLAWNSIKQLEDNLLLYGKYNLDSLEKIIHTATIWVKEFTKWKNCYWVRTIAWPHSSFCMQVLLEDYSSLTN